MKLPFVLSSLALCLGCSAPQKPGSTPVASASPSAAAAPAAAAAASSSGPRAASSRGAEWKEAPPLSLPPSTFALPGEIAVTKLDPLWEDSTGCGPQQMVAAGDAAYVLCSRQGEVLRVGPDKESKVIYRNEAPLSYVVVAGDHLVVGQVGANNGVLISVPLAGGPFRVMTRSIDGPHGLAADATAAFVVSQLKVIRVTRTGDERVIARTTNMVSLVDARGSELYFVDVRQPAPTAPARHYLFRVRGAGEPEVFAAFDEAVDQLFSDDTAVYVHLSGRNEIVRLPKSGAPSIVTKTFGVSLRPTSDGRHVYWLDQVGTSPTVLRAKITGGAAEPVLRLEPEHGVSHVALTDQHVVVMSSFGATKLSRWQKR